MGIIKGIKEFIVNRGFTLMLFGISAAAVGVVLYAFLKDSPLYVSTPLPKAALGLAFLGFASYFVGRISLQMQRNDNKRKARELISKHDDDGFEPQSGNDGESFEPPPPRNDSESGAQ
jgi:hypothetical protein